MNKLTRFFLLCLILLVPGLAKSQCTVQASNDTMICRGEKAYLNVDASFLMFDFHWYPSTGLNAVYLQNPVAQPLVTTTYYVDVSTLIDSNLIFNGDFEQGNTGFVSNYIFNATSLWNEGTYSITTNPNSVHSNFSPCGDHTTGSGKMMVINGAALQNTNIWCETVVVQPNTDYAFSTWLTSVHPTNPAVLQFSINGNVLGTPFQASGTTCQWTQFYEIWNSGSSLSAQICIVNQNTATNGNDFAIDDVSFKPFCIGSDSVTVYIDQVPADAGPDTQVCRGDSVHLVASGGVAYHWDAGPFTQELTLVPGSDTIYFVTVTDALGCQGTDSVRVSLLELPVAEAGPDQTICKGDSALLIASGGVSYLWTNNAGSSSTYVSPPLTSSYYVSVTDINNCRSYDSVMVWVRPAPVITVTPDTAICPGSSTVLNAFGGIAYQWFPSTDLSDTAGWTVTATPQDSITYTVTGTDESGCKNTASVKIDLLECELNIPNVFTPNGDAKNEKFVIEYKGRKKYDLRIYNRWGRLVFSTSDKTEYWDGTISGNACDVGVYYYVLRLDSTVYKGSVTLLK
ncbi:MAG: gliding motility-associated C-terminal domain-containing protein [Bacteroidales bacterium]